MKFLEDIKDQVETVSKNNKLPVKGFTGHSAGAFIASKLIKHYFSDCSGVGLNGYDCEETKRMLNLRSDDDILSGFLSDASQSYTVVKKGHSIDNFEKLAGKSWEEIGRKVKKKPKWKTKAKWMAKHPVINIALLPTVLLIAGCVKLATWWKFKAEESLYKKRQINVQHTCADLEKASNTFNAYMNDLHKYTATAKGCEKLLGLLGGKKALDWFCNQGIDNAKHNRKNNGIPRAFTEEAKEEFRNIIRASKQVQQFLQLQKELITQPLTATEKVLTVLSEGLKKELLLECYHHRLVDAIGKLLNAEDFQGAHALAFDTPYQLPPEIDSLIKGNILLLQHKPQEALPYLQDAMKRYPGDEEVAITLANCHAQLFDFDAAIDCVRPIRTTAAENEWRKMLEGKLQYRAHCLQMVCDIVLDIGNDIARWSESPKLQQIQSAFRLVHRISPTLIPLLMQVSEAQGPLESDVLLDQLTRSIKPFDGYYPKSLGQFLETHALATRILQLCPLPESWEETRKNIVKYAVPLQQGINTTNTVCQVGRAVIYKEPVPATLALAVGEMAFDWALCGLENYVIPRSPITEEPGYYFAKEAWKFTTGLLLMSAFPPAALVGATFTLKAAKNTIYDLVMGYHHDKAYAVCVQNCGYFLKQKNYQEVEERLFEIGKARGSFESNHDHPIKSDDLPGLQALKTFNFIYSVEKAMRNQEHDRALYLTRTEKGKFVHQNVPLENVPIVVLQRLFVLLSHNDPNTFANEFEEMYSTVEIPLRKASRKTSKLFEELAKELFVEAMIQVAQAKMDEIVMRNGLPDLFTGELAASDYLKHRSPWKSMWTQRSIHGMFLKRYDEVQGTKEGKLSVNEIARNLGISKST